MELQRKSVVHALEERTYSPSDINVSNTVEEASQVASYRYEYNTSWGKQVWHMCICVCT